MRFVNMHLQTSLGGAPVVALSALVSGKAQRGRPVKGRRKRQDSLRNYRSEFLNAEGKVRDSFERAGGMDAQLRLVCSKIIPQMSNEPFCASGSDVLIWVEMRKFPSQRRVVWIRQQDLGSWRRIQGASLLNVLGVGLKLRIKRPVMESEAFLKPLNCRLDKRHVGRRRSLLRVVALHVSEEGSPKKQKNYEGNPCKPLPTSEGGLGCEENPPKECGGFDGSHG